MSPTGLVRVAEITFGWPFASDRFTPDFSDDSARLLRIRDLANGASPIYTDEVPPADVWVEPGDVLIGMDGDFNVVRWTGPRSLLNQRMCRLRAVVPNDLRYIDYAIRAPLQKVNELKHATTVKHLSAGDVRRLALPYWEPSTQRAIADFLDRETSRVRDALQRLDDLTASAEQGYLAHARRQIVGAGHPRVLLKLVARPGTGHTPSRDRPEFWIEEECVLPWFGLADVWQIREDARDYVNETSERISARGLANSAAVKHPAGTVLLSRTASVGFVGCMAVDMAVTQDFMTWTCGPRILPEYLPHALRAIRPELMHLVQGSTHKTIYMPDLLSIKVALPTLAQQRSIVDELQPRLDGHRRVGPGRDNLRAALLSYRNSLIHEAVTGKLDISRLSDHQTDERLHAAVEDRLDEVAV